MFRLTKIEIDSNTVGKGNGLYKIYWVKNDQPVHIPRLLKVDDSGLLYIGQTNATLTTRLHQFRCTATMNSSNHSGAKKYKLFNIIDQIPYEQVFAEIICCEDSIQQEEIALKEYSFKFGEAPPLNG